MAQVLITGGAGFIGSSLAHALLKNGRTVISVDNFNDFYDPVLKQANIDRCANYKGSNRWWPTFGINRHSPNYFRKTPLIWWFIWRPWPGFGPPLRILVCTMMSTLMAPLMCWMRVPSIVQKKLFLHHRLRCTAIIKRFHFQSLIPWIGPFLLCSHQENE